MIALAVASILLAFAPPPAGGGVVRHNPNRAWQGLNLHVKRKNDTVRVVDMDGKLVHAWQAPNASLDFGPLVKPLDNGAILVTLKGPAGTSITELSWNGGILWSFNPSALGYLVHHDFERLSDGDTLLVTSRTTSFPSLYPSPILDDVILEVDPSGQLVWTWSMGAHAGQLPVSTESWNYLYNLPAPWVFHMNSLQSLPSNPWEASDPRFAAGNLLVSLREFNLIFIIEKSSGDIVWTHAGTIGQHHPRLVPDYLPGAGNILLIDNGGLAGVPQITRNYSRALQIHPLTSKTQWIYETPPVVGGLPLVGGSGGPSALSSMPFFFTPYKGATQRLPNGNVLITESETGRVFEVTRRGRIVWQYKQPAGPGGVDIYRWYRVDATWPTGPIQFPW